MTSIASPLVTVDAERLETLNPPLRPLFVAFHRPRHPAAIIDELNLAGFFAAIRDGAEARAEARLMEILVARHTRAPVIARRLRLFHRDLTAVTEVVRSFRIEVDSPELLRAASALEPIALDLGAPGLGAGDRVSFLVVAGPDTDADRIDECLLGAGLIADAVEEIERSGVPSLGGRLTDDQIERLFLARA